MSLLGIKPLTKADEYFQGATISAAVEGSGQMIYWKHCTIKVYRTGEEQTVIEKIPKCDGEALVRKGISLLLEDGPVVEE